MLINANDAAERARNMIFQASCIRFGVWAGVGINGVYGALC
jgi:hypothetical protein